MRFKKAEKAKTTKHIWASLYEEMGKQRNHNEPFIHAPSALAAPLSPKQLAEKIEIGIKRLFDTATKK